MFFHVFFFRFSLVTCRWLSVFLKARKWVKVSKLLRNLSSPWFFQPTVLLLISNSLWLLLSQSARFFKCLFNYPFLGSICFSLRHWSFALLRLPRICEQSGEVEWEVQSENFPNQCHGWVVEMTPAGKVIRISSTFWKPLFFGRFLHRRKTLWENELTWPFLTKQKKTKLLEPENEIRLEALFLPLVEVPIDSEHWISEDPPLPPAAEAWDWHGAAAKTPPALPNPKKQSREKVQPQLGGSTGGVG